VGLLLVEDNEKLSASLARGLGEEGFELEAVATGAAALARLARRSWTSGSPTWTVWRSWLPPERPGWERPSWS
jgi:CheY-like chemotaxis protein